jgi:hypothetical protein
VASLSFLSLEFQSQGPDLKKPDFTSLDIFSSDPKIIIETAGLEA